MTQVDTEGGLVARRAAAESIGLTPEHARDFVLINGVLEYRPASMESKQAGTFKDMALDQLKVSLAKAENQG